MSRRNHAANQRIARRASERARAARPVRPLLRAAASWAAPAAIVAGTVFAALPLRVQRPPHPQWPALFEYLDSNNIHDVWQGAASGPTGSRLYLERREWPLPTQDRAKNITAQPPLGAILLYHRRDGYAPGPTEQVLFHEGDLTLTRLDGPWRPVRSEDPGEE